MGMNDVEAIFTVDDPTSGPIQKVKFYAQHNQDVDNLIFYEEVDGTTNKWKLVLSHDEDGNENQEPISNTLAPDDDFVFVTLNYRGSSMTYKFPVGNTTDDEYTYSAGKFTISISWITP